jgi:hypothetical protein
VVDTKQWAVNSGQCFSVQQCNFVYIFLQINILTMFKKFVLLVSSYKFS